MAPFDLKFKKPVNIQHTEAGSNPFPLCKTKNAPYLEHFLFFTRASRGITTSNVIQNLMLNIG